MLAHGIFVVTTWLYCSRNGERNPCAVVLHRVSQKPAYVYAVFLLEKAKDRVFNPTGLGHALQHFQNVRVVTRRGREPRSSILL